MDRGAACLYGVSTYLLGTVGQQCSLFMLCQNLPPRDCGAAVQPFHAVSEPTSRVLRGRDTACLYGVTVTIQNGWNNRISDGCVYAQNTQWFRNAPGHLFEP